MDRIKVSNKATESKIKNAGFIVATKDYILKANLYNRKIILNINIDKEDMTLTRLDIQDIQTGQQYNLYNNNEKDEMSKQIRENYNSVIENLIKKGILEYE